MFVLLYMKVIDSVGGISIHERKKFTRSWKNYVLFVHLNPIPETSALLVNGET